MANRQIFNSILSINKLSLLIVYSIISGCSQSVKKPHPTPFDRYILWEKCGDCDFLEDFRGVSQQKSSIYYKFSHDARCYEEQCEKLKPFGFQPEKK